MTWGAPQLVCIHQRVVSESRLSTQKIRDDETLRLLLDHHDLYTPIDDPDLSIDNSDLTPDEAVEKIAAHLEL